MATAADVMKYMAGWRSGTLSLSSDWWHLASGKGLGTSNNWQINMKTIPVAWLRKREMKKEEKVNLPLPTCKWLNLYIMFQQRSKKSTQSCFHLTLLQKLPVIYWPHASLTSNVICEFTGPKRLSRKLFRKKRDYFSVCHQQFENTLCCHVQTWQLELANMSLQTLFCPLNAPITFLSILAVPWKQPFENCP